MARRNRTETPLDREISAAYRANGHGIQINILNIRHVYAAGRAAAAAGESVEAAVVAAIARYREN